MRLRRCHAHPLLARLASGGICILLSVALRVAVGVIFSADND